MTRVWVKASLLIAILAIQFVALEAGLRWYGGSEAAPAFQQLFMQDPRVGHRLRPGASARYTTQEFSTDIAINPQGVRDVEPIGPKAADERRVVILGDSLVMSVQVQQEETFAEQLERGLNSSGHNPRWRVINAGVQGYGPVDEWLFYKHVVDQFDPDLVLIVVFVGNDAVEAYDKRHWIDSDGPPPAAVADVVASQLRRVTRASMVLQNVRFRFDLLKGAFKTPTAERPLTTYLASPPSVVVEGLAVARQAYGLIAERASARGASTACILMPARFQTDDVDYEQLRAVVTSSGDTLLRDSATQRFRETLEPTGLPVFDLLPALQAEPQRQELFFQENIHLTPRGHQVVGRELLRMIGSLGLLGR